MALVVVVITGASMGAMIVALILWAYAPNLKNEPPSANCEYCEYSLMGLPAGGVCPECGTPIGTRPSAPTRFQSKSIDTLLPGDCDEH